ncbi:MAG: DUF305 domain-containing protein [Patescibacteria group bacterium]
MIKNNKTAFIIGGSIIGGIIIGCIICCLMMMCMGGGMMNRHMKMKGMYSQNMNGMHMMPDGTMMPNAGAVPPRDTPGMQGMMDHMNANLEGKTGDAFDQAFLEEMIVHHEGAVEMAEAALTNAKHPEIKKLSQDIITAQKKEIADMKAWLKAWYNK